METPDTVHGRLMESVHLSGYTMERACGELEWLLDDDRWKGCGGGFTDIDSFLATLDTAKFKLPVDQRKRLAARLQELRASDSATGRAIGWSRETVARDLGKRTNVQAQPSTPPDQAGNKTVETGTRTNVPPEWFQGDTDPSKEAKREATRAKRNLAKVAKRTADAASAKDAIGDDETYTILHGDCTTIAAGVDADSVDLVFTDPPYHDKTIGLYADLGAIAARVLKPGASLITYTSHHRIPEVIAMLQAAGLTFFWPIAMVHTGPSARMTEYGIVVKWKPLLWFVKGTFRRRDNMRFVDDLIHSTPEKSDHPWQQSVVEARYYVEALTEPGELVFDPFCGGGTTAVAASRAGRRWLTCDIDLESVYLARQRLRDALAPV
jgi:DNA modification methylase